MPENNIIGKYMNGNFLTTIYSDGTLVRETEDDKFVPAFASNMDIKLTNHCDMCCKFCHEGSSVNGKHADIMSEKFVDTLHPYQEVALGGGDVTSHPDLIPFLEKLKSLKVIANITISQKHFEEKFDLIQDLVNKQLIHGLGVSLVKPTPEFIEKIKQFPNAVIHIINGIVDWRDLIDLTNNDLKILILGYKNLRRGEEFYRLESPNIERKQRWLSRNLPYLLSCFKVVSFDNLAIEQLNVKKLLSEEDWNSFYMGDDSEFTYYIDMVERKFAKNSTAPLEERYDLLDSVDNMFDKVRKQ